MPVILVLQAAWNAVRGYDNRRAQKKMSLSPPLKIKLGTNKTLFNTNANKGSHFVQALNNNESKQH